MEIDGKLVRQEALRLTDYLSSKARADLIAVSSLLHP